MLSESPEYVKIPADITPSAVQQALSNGHGYQWTLLSDRAVPVFYGCADRHDMPELRMIGRWIILNSCDQRFGDLLERIMRVLSSMQGGNRLG